MAAKLVWPVRVSVELGERIDAAAAAAGLKRSVWMVRALESALGSVNLADTPGPAARRVGGEGGPTARSSASSRASGPVRLDTVSDVQRWAGERQAKLNAAKGRAS